MRRSLPWLAPALSLLVLPTACTDPTPEVTDGDTSGLTMTATAGSSGTDATGPVADSGSDTIDPTATTTTDASSSDDTGSGTGPICKPGTENCVCFEGACSGDGLVCVDDLCVRGEGCGNGVVDGEEDCDDGNAEPGDGCENDCTFSPGVAAISLGMTHTCALLNRQAIRCWGDGNDGRLGYGNTTHIGDNEPPSDAGDVDVGGSVVQVAAGSDFTCARIIDGAVRCWGNNAEGQAGLGHTGGVGNVLPPNDFPTIALGGPTIDVTAGFDHACAVLDGGEVRCWGANDVGQLGYGNTDAVGDNEDPVEVDPVMLGEPAVDVEAGTGFTCALLDNGDVRCWGDGANGRLGLGNTDTIGDDEMPTAVAPVDLGGETIAQLSAGEDHACARTDAGQLLCWGAANIGQLGYGNTNPIGDDEAPASAGFVDTADPVAVVGLGYSHSCAVLDGGDARCWGEATHGRIGNVDAGTDIGDDELPSDIPVIDIGGPVIDIDGGGSHSCAVLASGGVKCWGRANRGQLGYGNNDNIGDNEPPSAVGEVSVE